MSGLLIKDFYNIRKQIVWYLAMIVLFAVFAVSFRNISFASSAGLLVTISIPLTAIAYEERENWRKFLAGSGMSCTVVVLEKYLLGILFSAVNFCAFLVVFLVGNDPADSVSTFVVPVCMQFILLAVLLPLVFRFGVEKARTVMIVVVVAAVMLFIGALNLLGDLSAVSSLALSAAMIALTLLTLGLSMYISVRIYRKKEF